MIDTTKLREMAQTDWAKASGKWALLEAAADDLDALRGKVEVAEAGFNAAVSKASWQARTNGELNQLAEENRHMRAELERLRTIEAAARNLDKVKGRHNSEIAMNQLRETFK